MSTTEIIIILFFIVLAGVIVVGLSRSIMLSSQQGGAYYQGLTERIKLLRMDRMLNALGIETTTYARSHPVNEIEIHMNRCKSCSNTKQCDTDLRVDDVSNAADYCPNNPEMKSASTAKNQ